MSLAGVSVLLGAFALLTLVQIYFMLATFAYLTGWWRLARRHRARGPIGCRTFATQGVLLDAWGWSAPPLRLGHDAEGIVMRPLAAFRPIFPTVRVPWDAIVGIERRPYFRGEALIVRYGPSGHETLAFLPSPLGPVLAVHLRAALATTEAARSGNPLPLPEM